MTITAMHDLRGQLLRRQHQAFPCTGLESEPCNLSARAGTVPAFLSHL